MKGQADEFQRHVILALLLRPAAAAAVLCYTVQNQAGIVTSDILVTVSQGYAAEITGSPQDGRVDMLLAQRAPRLRGIVNGIDVTEWDPATDIHLAEKCVAVCGGGFLSVVPYMDCVHPGSLR